MYCQLTLPVRILALGYHECPSCGEGTKDDMFNECAGCGALFCGVGECALPCACFPLQDNDLGHMYRVK